MRGENHNGPVTVGLPMTSVPPEVDMPAFDSLGPLVRRYINETTRFRCSALGVLKECQRRGWDPIANDARIAEAMAWQESSLKGWADA
jgi:hypothetical protein